jgi:hypothetical protein
VQPEVSKFARVCSYDRAGYGWSDSGPEPRSSLQIAHELKQLLQADGEKAHTFLSVIPWADTTSGFTPVNTQMMLSEWCWLTLPTKIRN